MEHVTMEKTGGGYFIRSPRSGQSRTFRRLVDAQIYFRQESLAWEQRDSRRCITCGAALPATSGLDWCADSDTCMPNC